MQSFEQLVHHIDQPGIDGDPARDIALLQPDISRTEALAVQLAVKRRRASAGDRIIGHQASFTSPAIRAIFPDAPEPMVGTLLASIVRPDGGAISLDCEEAFVESEMGLLLARDIEGPDVTAMEVLAATEGFLPAIEIAPLRPGVREGRYSWPHLIAIQKAVGGYVIFGSRLTSPRSIDVRLEGCLVSVDNRPRASATGFEAMGSPLNVVAGMARELHAIGEKLHAGQLVITGTLAPPQVITPRSRHARVDFQSLGSVSINLEPRA